MNYLIPSPSGRSKIIGSLSPPLWMNSNVKSGREKKKKKKKTPICSQH